MKHVPLSVLENRIVRPGFESRLMPLLRFKGHIGLGRAHRLWNLLVSAKEHEADFDGLLKSFQCNRAYSHLCGPEKPITAMQLRSFAGRALDAPGVIGEEPHLKEYLHHLFPRFKGPFRLEPILPPPEGFIEAADRRNVRWAMEEFGVGDSIARRWFTEAGLVSAGGLKRRPDNFAELAVGKSLGWVVEEFDIGYAIAHRWFEEVGLEYATWEREKRPPPMGWTHFAPKETNTELALRFTAGLRTVQRWRLETGIVCHAQRKTNVGTGPITYPFLIHDGGKPEHTLLRKVNAAVPAHLDPDLRADICQDLMVGILCGDFDPDDLSLPAKEVGRLVQKMFPTKYGPLSLDAIMPGTDDFRLMDTITEENSLWANL